MGNTKDNLKPTTPESKSAFSGVLDLVRRKKGETNPKASAQTYVDQLQALDKTLSEMLIAKSQDVKNEPNRHDYNQFVLTELQLQEHLLQQIYESAARCAEKGEKN